MKITEAIITLLKTNEPKNYVYVSKSKPKLDEVRIMAMENIDFSNIQTKVLLVRPMGIGMVKGDVHGVYYDDNDTTQDFVLSNLSLVPEGFIKAVDELTREVKE